MTIVYALLSLAFAGVNDVVFRGYGRERRPVGLFVCLVGVVWTSVFLVLGAVRGTLDFSAPAVALGGVSGVLSAVANLLLVEMMKKTGATVAATIYRLNLVFVAVIAFIFLGEVVTGYKLVALVCAVVAVLLFANGGASRTTLDKYILILVGASFLRACMGICYKVASNLAVSSEVFLAINGVCWLVAGGVYFLWRQERALPCGRSVFGYALLSGFLICGIVLFMKLAVSVGDASVAVTISQFSFLVTCPVAVVVLKEKCTAKQLAGITLATVCVVLFAHG
ncbi:MAG: hypothetical protein A3K19_00445 [Lentisphaerae bacterium RIFOXYB12_FULL_65_16]|nr:MAG: hypothetical protein A3K18_09980 [Lentisphaerae bacterium RIFOXYA12_64_32]OGV89904.1 MAG: hypothetical protein A3K19_00445 [Lentisphaerae bacterium RIFOXYB12_FULL_65_16]